MHIEIEVPRPLLTGALLIGVVSFVTWSAFGSSTLSADITAVDDPVFVEEQEPRQENINVPQQVNAPLPQAMPMLSAMSMPMIYPYVMPFMQPPMYQMWGVPPGMQGQGPALWAPPMQGTAAMPPEENIDEEEVSVAQQKLRDARMKQELLDNKEESLREQLKTLEEERKLLGDNVSAQVEEQFRESTRALVELLQDEQKSERFILDTLNQMRIAQGEAAYLGKGLHGDPGFIRFVYPLLENLGLTTMFQDASYPFAFDHMGVDLRAAQGSTVIAVADGVVHRVSDKNDKGYNWITVDHGNGLVTIYGHISESLVVEGQPVKAGDTIATSGGMPGTPGAGSFTTGPHLHLEVWLNGKAIDPETYLPNTMHVDPW